MFGLLGPNGNRLNFVLKIDLLKAFLTADRGRKANSHSLQDVFKNSTVCCACPSPETYTASVVWCGVVCGVAWRGVVWCGVVWRGVV